MDTLFYDYENSLIGESKDIGMYNFFGSAAGGANQQRAVACIRYALEEVLGWDVEESIQKFDDYMIKAMKLTRVVDFINYPDEVPDRDPRYILFQSLLRLYFHISEYFLHSFRMQNEKA